MTREEAERLLVLAREAKLVGPDAAQWVERLAPVREDLVQARRFLANAGEQEAAAGRIRQAVRTTLMVDGEPLTVVEVAKATPEPDSTRKRYFLSVPPTTRTAREAVAWSFDFNDETDYSPAVET
jgi:hypothetical protein